MGVGLSQAWCLWSPFLQTPHLPCLRLQHYRQVLGLRAAWQQVVCWGLWEAEA